MTEKRQTQDQKRARHAWDVVVDINARVKDEKQRKEFGTQAKKLPVRILTSGLGQALAFLEAKKKDGDKEKPGFARLLRALDGWMAKQHPPADGVERLVVRIINGDAEFLRYATAECLAYLLWLVRFAEAEGLVDLKTES
jgi:CRISPR-associated protein Cmr5